jgi:hypothetical protein
MPITSFIHLFLSQFLHEPKYEHLNIRLYNYNTATSIDCNSLYKKRNSMQSMNTWNEFKILFKSFLISLDFR